MPAQVLTFPVKPVAEFGGLVVAPGTWLYAQLPGNHSDAYLITRVEGGEGQSYDVLGGMRPLPRTKVWCKPDGGASPERLVEHIDDRTLRTCERGRYTQYYGYLELIEARPEHRAAFVARCALEPARRAEAARKAEEAREEARRTVGPWFADLEEAIAGDRYRVRDTVEAKVIRRCLRELVGVSASVTVRRYSMASGLSFGPAKGQREWTDSEAAAIASIFPGAAWEREVYDRDTGERRTAYRVDDSLHPHKREDRSDGMTDYYDPGGFRVANEYTIAVSAILSDEVRKAEGVR